LAASNSAAIRFPDMTFIVCHDNSLWLKRPGLTSSRGSERLAGRNCAGPNQPGRSPCLFDWLSGETFEPLWVFQERTPELNTSGVKGEQAAGFR
jgi:hypothetical protein